MFITLKVKDTSNLKVVSPESVKYILALMSLQYSRKSHILLTPKISARITFQEGGQWEVCFGLASIIGKYFHLL